MSLSLSFVIPAYNAAVTLKTAVQSVAKSEKYKTEELDKHIEIIIVENGSTDETLQIADELSNEIPFVKVCVSEKGVSNARNLGIEKALGRYICFVDADDSLCDNALDELIEMTDNDADLIIYGYKKGNSVIIPNDDGQLLQKYCDDRINEYRCKLISNPTRFMAVWGKLFKTDTLNDNNIRFDKRLSLAEDSDFMIRYTGVCTGIWSVNRVIYNYSIDIASTVRSFDGKKNEKYTEALKISEQYILRESAEVKKAFEKYVLMHLNLIMVHEVFAKENPNRFRYKLTLMKLLSELDIFSNYISATTVKDCKSLGMIPIFLLKHHIWVPAAWVYCFRVYQNSKRKQRRADG